MASAFLILYLETAIVVLTNCVALMDPTDFIGQLITSTLLDEPVIVNFVNLSKAAHWASIASYATLIAYLDKHKTAKPPQHPLAAY